MWLKVTELDGDVLYINLDHASMMRQRAADRSWSVWVDGEHFTIDPTAVFTDTLP